VEDVIHFLGEVEELEFASGIADACEAADEFSDTGAVEVVDAVEVQDNLFLAFGDQTADGVTEYVNLFAEDDASGDVEDGDVGDFAGGYLQGHGSGC
jgi:hypothetical protein